jgi:class 3 adenylate cyclase/tetratricopeptide (TPR) repeat protein
VSATRQERKVVTVLFADLVGFTAQAEEMDPEDVAALLSKYHTHVKAELERYGGTVEKFIGDAVMAVFGAPVAHEDDPERAVRAALAIQDWAEEEAIELRMGINTGEALVTFGGEPMAAGDVVNTAARLQQAATSGTVLVGEMTSRATHQAIEYRESQPVTAKGKGAPVGAWEAVQPRARIAVERLHGASLVGRSRELSLLMETLAHTRQERSPQLVTLVGVPGIGKSRLVFELFKLIEAQPDFVHWRQGRCLPYGDGVTFWALGEIVKAQAGILETDSVEAAEAKLRALTADAWIAGHLRTLVGIGTEDELRAGDREEAFTAWRRFFEELAEGRPLVLVFEDLHWADENLFDFLDHLVDWSSRVPLLVLCTARPELLTRRPGWGGGKPNALTISLSPLSDEETARLLGDLLDRSVLPAETQMELLTRAGGNPLYAEQFARMLAERGSFEGLPLPETVQGLIAARLDLLDQGEKALLQNAAVVGKSFWLGALAALGAGERRELEERLHALERKEFVRRDRRSSVENEPEYAFLHVLVRDVAYGQIPRTDRADKHLRTAEWIESLGRPEHHAEMLAHHYRKALELAGAAGQETGDLAARAWPALTVAGDRAFALHAYPAAARFYEEALELVPAGVPDRAQLLFALGRTRAIGEGAGSDELAEAAEALVAAGDREAAAEVETLLYDLAYREGRRAAAVEHLEQARALVEGAEPSPAKARVAGAWARFQMIAGDSDEAIRFGREELEMAEELGLDELRAHALDMIGAARAQAGDPGGIEDLERSAELASDAHAPHELCRSLNNLSAMLVMWGQLQRAFVAVRRTHEVAGRFGQGTWLRWTRATLVVNAYVRGDWDESSALADDFIAEAEGGSPHYGAIDGYYTRGAIRLAQGDLAGAVTDAAKGLAAAREAKDPQVLFPSLGTAVSVFLAEGRRAEAAAIVDEALQVMRESRLGVGVTALPMLAWGARDLGGSPPLAEALEGSPYPWAAAARAVLAGEPALAAEILGEIGAKPDEAYAQLRAGQTGDRGLLELALAFYRSVGATRYIREGEALLAATA